MSNGDIQYLADSLLIEKLFLIDAGLNKQAGVSDLLGSLEGSVKNWAAEHIDTTSITGILTSLSDLMVPGILFKINPLFGALATVASMFGFSPSVIVKRILMYMRPKLERGESISLDEVNSIGRDAISSEAGSMEAEASKDMFWPLREIEKRGELVRFLKQGQYRFKSQTTPDIPFFGGSSGSVIERVFGQLFKTRQNGKAKWLLGGFIVWIIKTVLLGAGLIAVGDIGKHIGKSLTQTTEPQNKIKPDDSEYEIKPQDSPHPGGMFVSYKQPVKQDLTPTGYGQELHQNDSKVSTWYVPVIGGTVEATLLQWARYVYSEFEGQSALIASTPSFKRAVQEMRANFEPGAAHMQVPNKFKSIRQVVDLFANDVAAKL